MRAQPILSCFARLFRCCFSCLCFVLAPLPGRILQLAAGPSELGKYYEFVHFGCTSEDVGNLAYAKSIDDAK